MYKCKWYRLFSGFTNVVCFFVCVVYGCDGKSILLFCFVRLGYRVSHLWWKVVVWYEGNREYGLIMSNHWMIELSVSMRFIYVCNLCVSEFFSSFFFRHHHYLSSSLCFYSINMRFMLFIECSLRLIALDS